MLYARVSSVNSQLTFGAGRLSFVENKVVTGLFAAS